MVKLVILTWEKMDGDSLPFIHEIEWETINLSLVLSFLTNVVGEHRLRNKTSLTDHVKVIVSIWSRVKVMMTGRLYFLNVGLNYIVLRRILRLNLAF